MARPTVLHIHAASWHALLQNWWQFVSKIFRCWINVGADYLAGTGWAYPHIRGPRSDISIVPILFGSVRKMDGKCVSEENKMHNFIDKSTQCAGCRWRGRHFGITSH